MNKDVVIEALKSIYDPEIPVNIWDLGLVYDIKITEKEVVLTMTFTSPTCPMMEELLDQVKTTVSGISKGLPVKVNLVWEPAWDLSRMSDKARLELDLTESGW